MDVRPNWSERRGHGVLRAALKAFFAIRTAHGLGDYMGDWTTHGLEKLK